VETEAFGYTKTGLAAAGDTMGLLFHETASKQLGFFRLQGLSNWSDRTGTVPVMTNSFNDYGIPTELTHYDYDFSVTKLQVGYRMDVYINRTLWYTSTNTSLPDFTDVSLVLAGGSGTSNPVGRIRNAMLIRGPVNSSAGILAIPCITVGDSNLYASAYQSTDARSSNNPLITGVLAASDGGSTSFGPSNSAVGISINQGNIFLNSALHDSGVSAQYQFSNKINNLSLPGGSISPGGGGTLESLVNMALALSPKPEYWFCQMGGNDVGLFTAIPSVNNGYPILSDWVTYIVDLYLAQIDRMLLASTTAKVFIASPCRWYTATDWADASTYEETKVTEVSSLVAEMESRIPNHFPGRVFFVNQHTNWTPLYHALPNATSFSNVHFNPEGNRVQAQNFASILPNLRQT
jgi:lysophospholipase L1-like esterase